MSVSSLSLPNQSPIAVLPGSILASQLLSREIFLRATTPRASGASVAKCRACDIKNRVGILRMDMRWRRPRSLGLLPTHKSPPGPKSCIPSRRQCAAVKTQSRAISVPPQMPRSTCQEKALGSAGLSQNMEGTTDGRALRML